MLIILSFLISNRYSILLYGTNFFLWVIQWNCICDVKYGTGKRISNFFSTLYTFFKFRFNLPIPTQQERHNFLGMFGTWTIPWHKRFLAVNWQYGSSSSFLLCAVNYTTVQIKSSVQIDSSCISWQKFLPGWTGENWASTLVSPQRECIIFAFFDPQWNMSKIAIPIRSAK